MQVSTSEIRERIDTLLPEVERGAEIVITRDGSVVARIIPAEGAFDRDAARVAAAGLREASRGLSLGGLGIKDMIDEGRN